MSLVQCWECDHQVSEMAANCPNCGAPINKSSTGKYVTVDPQKSRSMAAALAVFLGGVGVHKFYLNKPGWGLLYLIFCWTFIPAIIGLLEGLSYICMSDESFREIYSK